MSSFDPSNAECVVLVFKEGFLSWLGHDLKLRVSDFSLTVDEGAGTLDARADASSLRVACVMRNGVELEKPLSAGDKRSIESAVIKDVLHSEKFPEIRFRSAAVVDAGGEYEISGTLTLHGVERAICARTRRSEGRLVAEIPIHQPDYGIKPYSILMGALRAKPDVVLQVSARV